MNEQCSKKILFNKSTLLSLKAELLKKQEEVQEKKHLPQHSVQNFKSFQATADNKNKNEKQKKRCLKDNLKEVDTEELEACRKSKLALTRKAELYEHLSDGAGDSQLAERFLVDFNVKKSQIITTSNIESISLDTGDETDIYEDDKDWTEFTDCLGRSRKCLKSDLEYYKKRDKELVRAMTSNSKEEVLDNSETETQKPILVQRTNDYLQSLREKWEGKEKELLAKDRDIHYQDLLFDEARIHGVGYYSFSTDETERKKQMEELIKRRQETLRAQKQAEELRKKRDELVAARVAAARARQRVRAGLPPEDPEEKKKEFTTCLLGFLNQQKNEADQKAKEEESKLRDEREKERQKLREVYVRDWDIGKDGFEGKVKKFRELSQEEYVEQQRSKRVEEFAPLKAQSEDDRSKYNFDSYGKKVGTDVGQNQNKTWSDVRPVKTPPPLNIGDISDETQKGLYFSTRNVEKVIKYKNFVKAQEATPIMNELSDEDEGKDVKDGVPKRKVTADHAEIAPPPTYDYYGPTLKHRRTQKPFNSDMREAMAQGSKSLEIRESSRKLPQHYDFTFD